MGKATTAGKPLTKSEIFTSIAGTTALTRKQVSAVYDALSDLIAQSLGKKGPGIFTLPGLAKIKRVFKPATKARKGINPFTGQEAMFKAKPARNVVKAVALKGLKNMV